LPLARCPIASWSDEYHAPLGLAATIMHVLPRDAAALAQQPAVQELVAAGRLLLVLWDQFQLYDGWRDYDLQVGPTVRKTGCRHCPGLGC
jgi:hypothetical protein